MAAEEQRLLQSAQEEPIAIDYSDAFSVAEGKMTEQNRNKYNKNVEKKHIKLLFCFLIHRYLPKHARNLKKRGQGKGRKFRKNESLPRFNPRLRGSKDDLFDLFDHLYHELLCYS